MLPISATQAGDVLAGWLAKNSIEPAILSEVVAETGYNDSPWFGATKARTRLVAELATANSALVIFAVNQVFAGDDASAIIEAYLRTGTRSVFSILEAKDVEFGQRYQRRLVDYFDALHSASPGVAMSFVFLSTLGLKPLESVERQALVAVRFGKALSSMVAVLRTFSLVETDAAAVAQLRAIASRRRSPTST